MTAISWHDRPAPAGPHTATRALTAGTATAPQLLWVVAAAGALAAVFAPLAALLYQRK